MHGDGIPVFHGQNLRKRGAQGKTEAFPSPEMPYAGANIPNGWFGTHRAPEHF